jgi:hypothetical protein
MKANSSGQCQPDSGDVAALELGNGFPIPKAFVYTADKKNQREANSREDNQEVGYGFVDSQFNRLNMENMDFSDILCQEAIQATCSLSF